MIRLNSTILSLIIILTAGCGGGGGTPPPDFPLLPEQQPTERDTELQASVTDSRGNSISSLPLLGSAELRILVNEGKNRPLEGEIVFIEGENINVSNPSVVTDANGNAFTELHTSPENTTGTAVITVTLDEETSEQIYLPITEAPIRLGHMRDGAFIEGEIGITNPVLGTDGNTAVQLAVVDDNFQPVTEPIEIFLTSPCANASPPLSDLSSSVITSGGLATASYTRNGCDTSDTISANVGELADTIASGLVQFTDEVFPEIEFTAISQEQISLRGTGSAARPEVSQVVFTLSTPEGDPAPNYPVNFELTNTQGGIALSQAAEFTDSQGVASTAVRAGSSPARTQVRATIKVGDNLIAVLSDEILISSGLPDQNSISLSADVLNVLSNDTDGVVVNLTVRLADHFNNPVPDDTTVNFATEYGAVDALCQTTNGACDVVWTSQEPRNSLNFSDLTPTVENTLCGAYADYGPCPEHLSKYQAGRTTIIATVLGEESFTDSNGNGRYDDGEYFADLPEAFIDHNEDRKYNPASNVCDPGGSANCASGAEESFYDLDDDGRYSTGNELYNGSLCPISGEYLFCSRGLVTVRADVVIVGSSADQRMALTTTDNQLLKGEDALNPGSYVLYIADLYNNPPPGGTTVTLEGIDCPLIGNTSFSRFDGNSAGAWTVSLRMDESENEDIITGYLSATLTLPDDRTIEYNWPCEDSTLVEPEMEDSTASDE